MSRTIAIPKSLKEEIMEFGNKGETCSDIIKRLVKSAKERQLHDLLMSDENTISIEEALANARYLKKRKLVSRVLRATPKEILDKRALDKYMDENHPESSMFP